MRDLVVSQITYPLNKKILNNTKSAIFFKMNARTTMTINLYILLQLIINCGWRIRRKTNLRYRQSIYFRYFLYIPLIILHPFVQVPFLLLCHLHRASHPGDLSLERHEVRRAEHLLQPEEHYPSPRQVRVNIILQNLLDTLQLV